MAKVSHKDLILDFMRDNSGLCVGLSRKDSDELSLLLTGELVKSGETIPSIYDRLTCDCSTLGPNNIGLINKLLKVRKHMGISMNDDVMNMLVRLLLEYIFVDDTDLYSNLPKKYRPIIRLHSSKLYKTLYPNDSLQFKSSSFTLSMTVYRKALSAKTYTYDIEKLTDSYSSLECFKYAIDVLEHKLTKHTIATLFKMDIVDIFEFVYIQSNRHKALESDFNYICSIDNNVIKRLSRKELYILNTVDDKRISSFINDIYRVIDSDVYGLTNDRYNNHHDDLIDRHINRPYRDYDSDDSEELDAIDETITTERGHRRPFRQTNRLSACDYSSRTKSRGNTWNKEAGLGFEPHKVLVSSINGQAISDSSDDEGIMTVGNEMPQKWLDRANVSKAIFGVILISHFNPVLEHDAIECFKLLYRYNLVTIDYLRRMITYGSYKCLEFMIDKFSINNTDISDGYNLPIPLRRVCRWALRYGRIEIINLLLDKFTSKQAREDLLFPTDGYKLGVGGMAFVTARGYDWEMININDLHDHYHTSVEAIIFMERYPRRAIHEFDYAIKYCIHNSKSRSDNFKACEYIIEHRPELIDDKIFVDMFFDTNTKLFKHLIAKHPDILTKRITVTTIAYKNFKRLIEAGYNIYIEPKLLMTIHIDEKTDHMMKILFKMHPEYSTDENIISAIAKNNVIYIRCVNDHVRSLDIEFLYTAIKCGKREVVKYLAANTSQPDKYAYQLAIMTSLDILIILVSLGHDIPEGIFIDLDKTKALFLCIRYMNDIITNKISETTRNDLARWIEDVGLIMRLDD